MKYQQYLRILSRIFFIWFILTSCEVNSDQNLETDIESLKKSVFFCDSLYNSNFNDNHGLIGFETINHSELKTLDQLIWFSDSTEGHFTISFNSDSISKPKLLRANFLYFDRERRKRNPKIGMYFQENYTIEFSKGANQVTLKSALQVDKTFYESHVLDTVKVLVYKHFLGDSLYLSKLSFIQFKYQKPPTIDEFLYLSNGMFKITKSLLADICSQYPPNDPILKYKIWKLAHLGIYLSYDWAETTESTLENLTPPPGLDKEFDIRQDTAEVRDGAI